jgi:hypothetical protein
MNSLIDIIKERHSCRSYQIRKIDPLLKSELQSYINVNGKGILGEEIKIEIIERDKDSSKQLKLDYGIISNHSCYILGKVKNDSTSRMSYGYVVEKIVIKATALGLNSCWVGYFDSEYFTEIKLSSEFEIPSIVIIGYEGKSSLGDKVLKFSVKSSKRKEWDQLFFAENLSTPLKPKSSGFYEDALEMLRLAPSSGNTQPWRVIMDHNGKSFHFFKKIVSPKYESMGLHDVDMGIALAHFELIAKQYRISGKWERIQNIFQPITDDIKYMISWTEEK